MTFSIRAIVLLIAIALGTAACTAGGSGGGGCCAQTVPESAMPAPDHGHKVLLIVEENHAYNEIIGDSHAPYLNELAGTYGTATQSDAGYPVRCPSLAAYLLLTSGDTHGVCDDRGPRRHPMNGANVFAQVSAAGRQWRAYAESTPMPCALDNSSDGHYLVRHVPATYYLNVRADCRRWAVPLGTPAQGPLHHDITAGRLPAFAFVTPDACNDMHGASGCPADQVSTGDQWLRTWVPQILAGPDYRSGRLTVIITWDEGSDRDNHIPTLVISPTTRHITSTAPYTPCSTLRTVETLLRLPPLGCAATAPSMAKAFRL